ncbi:hypothetical protein VKT23_016539 [Stygiomarasmius scandens]|uniref:Uncharacterized protein n=1 Tax=Marasmiellus scandens TaxID=2682957 RepID=A0ABR1IUP9_9AGAR
MSSSKLLKFIFIATSLVHQTFSAEADLAPVFALGDIVAIQHATGGGSFFWQDPDGSIREDCNEGQPISGALNTCGPTGKVIVPSGEALYGTPLAAAGFYNNDNGLFFERHLYYISPNFTLSEWVLTNTGTFLGANCTQCVHQNGFQVLPQSQALYAIGNSPAATGSAVLRVGFVSPSTPNGISEANMNSARQWSISTLRN